MRIQELYQEIFCGELLISQKPQVLFYIKPVVFV